jgi:hypothetical protein
MKNLIRVGFLASAMFVAVGASAGPVFVQLDTMPGFSGFKTTVHEFYINQSFAINDRYSITPELVFTLRNAYADAGTIVSHDLLRLTATDKGLGMVGDWKLTGTYQYMAPTTLSLQKQGGVGVFFVRPNLSKSWGKFSLLLRDRVALYLQRNSYALNDSSGAQKPNPLMANLLEVIPSYDLGANFSLSIYLGQQSTFVMGGPNGGKTSWVNYVFQSYEIYYTAEQLSKTTFGLGVDSVAKFGGGEKFKPYSKDSMNYTFKVQKSFN